MNSRKNVSLAAHLSTKCCEEVWNLAGSLQQEIIVTKLSRMEAWPKSFEAARPTDNNIALYFLPCEMRCVALPLRSILITFIYFTIQNLIIVLTFILREDADLDQLVKEVVENDMVLQAVIGEAEMLIFPSILLPERHQSMYSVLIRKFNCHRKSVVPDFQMHVYPH